MVSVAQSTDLSILVQAIVGLVSLRGIMYKVPSENQVLVDVLRLETIVQAIELIFYVFFLRNLARLELQDMATIRYYDWVITTPVMLFTTIVYFGYEAALHNNTQIPTMASFIEKHKEDIKYITLANFGMLAMGYLGETRRVSKGTALVWGFVFFVLAFNRIYTNYAVHSPTGQKLFKVMFSLWSIYGIAFIFTDVLKNNVFNVLDVFAKNFFGLFLYYKVKSLRIPQSA